MHDKEGAKSIFQYWGAMKIWNMLSVYDGKNKFVMQQNMKENTSGDNEKIS